MKSGTLTFFPGCTPEKIESESPDVVSYIMKNGNKYLPRLPREYYQGDAMVHRTQTTFVGDDVRRLFPIALLVFFIFFSPSGIAETNSAALPMLQNFLAQEALNLDASFLQGVSNRAEWESRRPQLKQEFLEMLGLWPMPERTPLRAEITGRIDDQNDYRVENLHFQSRPGLYVTGNLYLPKNWSSEQKLPAVLYVCGHSPKGRDGNKTAFQHHGRWFARNGYVCLIIDTLQLGEIPGIHHGTYRHDRWWWHARGFTPAGVECWNGIRAIDYLQSRPEVDTNRIGVTGISGGGASTFWITAADDRVRVAVPVSGMSDLEDYVGQKIVNGHCDCMFLHNCFQWSWSQIAALVVPRPMLFENSGHDTIFPMPGNERIRTRLERMYGFYTNRVDKLFDIGITPGGHEDHPELRLMAFRWFNRHLKGDNSPVVEPVLPDISGAALRAFPSEPPSDSINGSIDEVFVPVAARSSARNSDEFLSWKKDRIAELHRLVFRQLSSMTNHSDLGLKSGVESAGALISQPGIRVSWRFFPGTSSSLENVSIAILDGDDSLEKKPEWLMKAQEPVLLVAPRGGVQGEPAPFYFQRSFPLIGSTLDGGKFLDVVAVLRSAVQSRQVRNWKVVGRGRAGVIGAYAAIFEPLIAEVVVLDPPGTHREGPFFLNVLRVIDVPEAFALLAPRSLNIVTGKPEVFAATSGLYQMGNGRLQIESKR